MLLSGSRDIGLVSGMDSSILIDTKRQAEENLDKPVIPSQLAILEAMENTDHNNNNNNTNSNSNVVGVQMSSLEAKFQDFMKNTDNKLDAWMRQTLKKVTQQSSQNNLTTYETTESCANCQSLRNRHDTVLKLNIEREKEVLELKEQLSTKDAIIRDLQKEVKSLSKELNAKNNRLSDLRLASNSGFEAKIIQLEITTSKQNLQLAALQEQNNMLNAQNKLKDRMVCSKQNELNVICQKVKKQEMQRNISRDSLAKLRPLPRRNTNPDMKKGLGSSQPSCCQGDVVIIHDLFHKGFNVKLLKSKKLVIKEIWATKLKDALTCAQNMKMSPKVVLLHTGTKDLALLSEEEMVKGILDVYNCLHRKNIKFIWSNLTPRCDDFDANTKGYFVNVRVAKLLQDKPGAYIERNDDFYLRDMLQPSILDALQDGDE